MIAACRREVESLHRFFEQWLRAPADRTAQPPEVRIDRLKQALADDFQMITPSGRLSSRAEVLDGLRSARGSKASDFRISITWIQGREIAPDLVVALYRERQVESRSITERVSSALFRRREGSPEGVEWVHLHETWTD